METPPVDLLNHQIEPSPLPDPDPFYTVRARAAGLFRYLHHLIDLYPASRTAAGQHKTAHTLWLPPEWTSNDGPWHLWQDGFEPGSDGDWLRLPRQNQEIPPPHLMDAADKAQGPIRQRGKTEKVTVHDRALVIYQRDRRLASCSAFLNNLRQLVGEASQEEDLQLSLACGLVPRSGSSVDGESPPPIPALSGYGGG